MSEILRLYPSIESNLRRMALPPDALADVEKVFKMVSCRSANLVRSQQSVLKVIASYSSVFDCAFGTLGIRTS